MTKIQFGPIAFGLISLCIMGCSDVRFSTPTDGKQSKLDPEIPAPVQRISETFTQGAETAPVDVLVVVDNSPSMRDDQIKLGRKMNHFLGSLQGVDWRLGITTTDVSGGQFGLKGSLIPFARTREKFLGPNSPDFLTSFLNTVVRQETIECGNSTCPSSNEQPLKASILAMQKHQTDNSPFFRDEAVLSLIMISDEDEMSTGPAEATQPIEVLNTAKSLWPEKLVKAYGIVIPPGDAACKNSQAISSSEYGYFVAELVRLTGGVLGSVCDSDFSTYLSAVGKDLRRLLNQITLSSVPVESTIKIKYLENDSYPEWELNGKRLKLLNPPPEGTKIVVEYLPKK